MERAAGKVLIWSDEKMFAVESVTNNQNDRVYAHGPGDLSINVRSHLIRQKPASVIVWAAVASDGSKSPLVVIDEGVKVNSQVYLNMLQEKVFFLGSLNHLGIISSSHKTVRQLIQRM